MLNIITGCNVLLKKIRATVENKRKNFPLVPMTFPSDAEELAVFRMNQNVLKSILGIESHKQVSGANLLADC